ncbi:MAG: aldehyde ferredoxin oxidoreductase N-terminal domain-containing protein [Desulfobacterales bacterium]
MEYLSANKILVVNLDTSEITDEELDNDLVGEKIGGAALAKHLYQQHVDGDPIVIGTGLLTGTLFPAAAAGVITAKSPVTGKICHCPITLKVGLEIQYSGFDYIVIKGQSPKPVFLWVHDGVADLESAADVWGKDVWQTTDAWRKTMGDDLIQTVVIGKAGEDRSDLAQVCFNYWASGDRFGFGRSFGTKNLKGLAFRGMGLLEISDAEEFVELALDVLEEVKEGGFVGKKGIGDLCAAVGETDVNAWLAPIVHRHSACYNTPYAGNTFVFLDEDAGKLTEPEHPEPGFLITDMFGLIGFKKLGLSAADACTLLKACAKYGVDAAGVAELSQAAGKKTPAEIQAAIPTLKGAVTRGGRGIFSPWCPNRPIFADFDDAGDNPAAWWERRMAVAAIFGIHPLFAVMAPEITEDDLLESATVGTGIEFSPAALDNAVAYLLGQ